MSNVKLAALFLILSLTACSSEKPHQAGVVRPVKTVVIESAPTLTVYSYAGVVTARHEIPSAFQVSGKLASRLVEVGDAVKSQQLLATLDDKDLKIQEQISEGKLSSAKSNLELTEAELQRYSPLLKKGYVTASQLHQFRAKYESAVAEVKNAANDLQAAQRKLAYTNLYSQTDGVVVDTSVTAGEVVEAGKPILKIATSGEKEITINVPEHRVLEWKNPQNVIEVSLWADSSIFYKANIREIASDTDPVTRTFTIKLSVPKADSNVMLGMTANVTLHVKGKASEVRIPVTSIFYDDTNPKVWVVNKDTLMVQPVIVSLGQYTEGDMVTVKTGLKNGDMIVTAGVHHLIPGQKISLLGKDE